MYYVELCKIINLGVGGVYMKKCKKIMCLLLTLIMMISLVGCGNSESESTSENQSSSEVESTSENTVESNSDFDKYNIVSVGDVEINKVPEYEGDKYYDLRVKITNNSDQIIRDASVTFYAYDKEGTMIDTTEGQQNGSIEPNKSFYIESTIEKNKDIDTIKVDLYTYNIGEYYYKVDLISKFAEVYQ